jgi:hypothetical protein
MNRRRPAPDAAPRLAAGGSLAVVLLTSALLVAPAPAAGQSPSQRVTGTITEAGASTPVDGAMVVLLDGNRVVDRVLTDARGAFVLAAPEPGRYELRIDRIGYASTFSNAFDIAEGETVVRSVTTSIDPVVLEGLGVSAAGRCDDRSAGEVAVVWDEVRKALEAATWTADRELYRMAWTRWVRQLDANAERILDERRERRRTYTTRPFAAVDADSLAATGFVHRVDGSRTFLAPDADVLLSAAFLEGHCFGLERRSEEGRRYLGLRFRPVEGRRLPDVEGVLWIDERSRRLETLEYRYVNLGRVATVRGEDAHGSLRFQALPNGTWIIEEWNIRMPRLLDVRDGFGRTVRYDVAGYVEEGGAVTSVTDRGGALVRADRSAVVGVVTDSLGGAAPGASVSIVGTELDAITDADGAFRIDGVGVGTWTVVATHPTLTAYGHEGTRAAVVVERDGEGHTGLPLPSLQDLARERCRDRAEESEHEGALIGRVLTADGRGASGAEVRVTWTAFRGAVRSSVEGVGTTADAAGVFTVCGLPTGTTLIASAFAGEGSSGSGTVEARIPDDAAVGSTVVPITATSGAAAAPAELRVRDPAVERWLRSVGFDVRRDRALASLTNLEIGETGELRLDRILDDHPRLETEILVSGESVVWLERSMEGTPDSERCRLEVYLNGSLVRYRFDRVGVPGLDATLQPRWLSGLEVFDGASAPVGAPDSCGALLLWVDEVRSEDDPQFVGSIFGRVPATGAGDGPVRLVLRPGGVEAMIDDQGRFDFGPVPPGGYDVEVEVPEWGTLCLPVDVRMGAGVELVVDPAPGGRAPGSGRSAETLSRCGPRPPG